MAGAAYPPVAGQEQLHSSLVLAAFALPRQLSLSQAMSSRTFISLILSPIPPWLGGAEPPARLNHDSSVRATKTLPR